MKYATLDAEQQKAGIMQRISQLEGEYFTIEVYIQECEIIGDTKQKYEFLNQREGIQKRLDYWNEQIKAYPDSNDES